MNLDITTNADRSFFIAKSIFKIEAPWYFQPLRPHLVPHKLLLLNTLNNENTQIFSASPYSYVFYNPMTRVMDIMIFLFYRQHNFSATGL